jgi:hypothetical protein
MPKFVIEREVPGAGRPTVQERNAIAQKSNGVLQRLGPEIQWVQSYFTDDKIYCVYIASSAELIKRHAQESGFPANTIAEVRSIVDPNS